MSYPYDYPYGRRPEKPRYRWYHFLGDLFMIAMTGGLWLIWIFVREMRGQRR